VSQAQLSSAPRSTGSHSYGLDTVSALRLLIYLFGPQGARSQSAIGPVPNYAMTSIRE